MIQQEQEQEQEQEYEQEQAQGQGQVQEQGQEVSTNGGANGTFGLGVVAQPPVGELQSCLFAAAIKDFARSCETTDAFPIEKARDLTLHNRGHAEETRR